MMNWLPILHKPSFIRSCTAATHLSSLVLPLFPHLHSDYYVLRPQRTPFPFSLPVFLLFNSASLSHFIVPPFLHIPPLAQQICNLFLNDLHGRRLLSSSGLSPFLLFIRFISISSSHRSLTLMPMSTFSISSSSDASGREPLERYISSTRPWWFP